MSFLRMGRMVGLALILALALGSVAAWADTQGLQGKCKGENGEPLVDHIILIERLDIKGTWTVKTNKKGEYIYIGLPMGDYKITLKNPAGQDLWFFKKRVSFQEMTQLDFDMAKERKAAAEEQKKRIEQDPELKRQMEEQAKEVKQYASLKELFEQSNKLMDAKMYADAIPLLEQALPMAKSTNIPIVLARLAECYHRTKAYDRAVDAYQKAAIANPNEAAYHNNLGNVYADMGKLEEAAAEFKKAAEVNPAQAATYYYNYGAIMYNQGKMDEAAGAFQKAVEINPAYADGQFMLGRTLMAKLDLDPKTGKVIPAPGTVEALEAYLKLEPSGKYAAEAQSMLQTIQGSVETTYKKQKKGKTT